MNPIIRIAVTLAALTGACLIVRVAWPAVASNIAALKSWDRTEGEVRSTNGAIEFEIGREPDSYRAFAAVDHTWGLSLFTRVPLLVDPADRARVKPAGVLQMWLSTAQMSVFVLLLLIAAVAGARFGTGQAATESTGASTESRWMFSPSPGPASESIVLRAPARQWKMCLIWSLLGVAMVAITMFANGGSLVSRVGYMTLGSAFTLFAWGCAWQTYSMRISANQQLVRMTSVLGWRDLPWNLVRRVEDQDVFTTYYNGQMRMWELPFPGSTVRVFAFNSENDRTLMSISPELEPRESMTGLLDLCADRTGLRLQKRKVAIRY